MGGRVDRNDPLACALAQHLDAAVRPQVALIAGQAINEVGRRRGIPMLPALGA